MSCDNWNTILLTAIFKLMLFLNVEDILSSDCVVDANWTSGNLV